MIFSSTRTSPNRRPLGDSSLVAIGIVGAIVACAVATPWLRLDGVDVCGPRLKWLTTLGSRLKWLKGPLPARRWSNGHAGSGSASKPLRHLKFNVDVTA